MPRKRGKVPSYCQRKASGQAVVRIDGVDHYLGPYGSPSSQDEYQRLVAEWLARKKEAFLFSPKEAEEERNRKRREARRTPMTPSQSKRSRQKAPKRPKRDRYDRDSYRRAIEYAARLANRDREKRGQPPIPHWFPLQLRHSRATEVRRSFGLEGAQVALGHVNASVTEVYAEKNLELAVKIARRTG